MNVEGETLRVELERLKEEKAIAAEVFTLTVERYERTIANLEKELRAATAPGKWGFNSSGLTQRTAVDDCSADDDLSASYNEVGMLPAVDLTPMTADPSEVRWCHFLSGKNHRRPRALQKLLSEYPLPERLRGYVWLQSVADRFLITPELYDSLTRRVKLVRSVLLRKSPKYASQISEAFGVKAQTDSCIDTCPWEADLVLSTPLVRSFVAISVDLPRCLYCLDRGEECSPSSTTQGSMGADEADMISTEGETLSARPARSKETVLCKVRDLLETFCVFREDIGYTQGMDSLALMAVLQFPDDQVLAFRILANLLLKQPLRSFLTFQDCTLELYVHAFERLVQVNCPTFLTLLSRHQVPISSFFVEWLLTLFCRALPLSLVPTVWDEVLCCGTVAVFRVALSLVLEFMTHRIAEPTELELRQFVSTGLSTIQPSERAHFLTVFREIALTQETVDAVLKHGRRQRTANALGLQKAKIYKAGKALYKLLSNRETSSPSGGSAETPASGDGVDYSGGNNTSTGNTTTSTTNAATSNTTSAANKVSTSSSTAAAHKAFMKLIKRGSFSK